MSYPKQLLRLQPTRGINLDIADSELGPEFWSTCRNVNFRDGFATRISGFRDAYVPEFGSIAPARLLHVLNVDLLATNYWIVADQFGSVFAVEPGNARAIDGGLFLPVPEPQAWSSALINGIPILSNSLNEPVYWDGGAAVQVLPDWTPTESAKFIAVNKFHVFAMNLSGPGGDFDNLVKWSAATEPGTVPASWTPQADNDAGSVELADSPGEVLCAYPFNDGLIIYKRSSTYLAQYVGGQNVYAFRKIQSSYGALTKRSVCDIGRAHFVVTDGDIVISDGINVRQIGESRVKDSLFNNLDPDFFNELFCVYNRSRDEVLVAFPELGSDVCSLALTYDVSKDSFGIRELPDIKHAAVGFINDSAPANNWIDRTETWASANDTWGSSIVSNARDSLVLAKESVITQEDTQQAVNVNAQLARFGLDFGEPERFKFVRRAHIRTRDPYGGFTVRVGGQATPTGPVTWSAPQVISDTDQVVNCTATGRYIAVEVTSSNASIWKLTGLDLEAEFRGYH